MTKITIAICTRSFLLNRSASLPQTGVAAVAVSRVAVTTQVYCACEPLSAPRILGRAVETTVPLIIATNSTRSRPLSDSSTSRWFIAPGAGGAETLPGGAAASVVVRMGVVPPTVMCTEQLGTTLHVVQRFPMGKIL